MYPIEFFWLAANRFPERTAVIAPGRTLTFRELARLVLEWAAAIAAKDSGQEEIVCVGAANTVDHLIAILAVLAAGKVWTPLNPRNGDPELKRLIEFVRPSLILVDEGMRERVFGEDRCIKLLSEIGGGGGEAAPMGPLPGPGFRLDRTQAIKFTGGTTGFPKGVKQPLRAWNTNIVTQIHTMGLTPDDRYLVAAPLTHGTSTYMLPLLGSGGALVFPEEAKPAGLLEAAERHRASLFFAPPTLILALIEEQRHAPRDLRALRYLIYGGAPMRIEQIRAAQSCFGNVLCTCYGQTEAPQIATFLSPAEMVGDDLSSVGRPTMLTQVGILTEEGNPLPPGEEGEVAIRGDLVMTGYYNAPEETERTLVAGWLRTGDAGILDGRGFLFLKDRIRDVIITGGFNVYPSDVEVVITAHPAVVDCSVIGVPDEKWGEAVHAAVQLRPGYDLQPGELTAMVKHELGSVKTPKEIHIFDSLPRSPVGKVLKPAIREEVQRRRRASETGPSQ
jgi:fatty-acyl-CoA synthase